MTDVSMRQMLEAGVHFGHQTRFWNPKMAPFIFGERNKIHIINLEQTLPLYARRPASSSTSSPTAARVLFVGTKRSAREAIAKEAARCGMPYVSQRWLGGMLTNFKTIRQSIKRLAELDDLAATGTLDQRSKKRGTDGAPRAREARAQPRRHQGNGRPAGRDVRHRRRPREHRHARGPASSASRSSRSSTPTARPTASAT